MSLQEHPHSHRNDGGEATSGTTSIQEELVETQHRRMRSGRDQSGLREAQSSAQNMSIGVHICVMTLLLFASNVVLSLLVDSGRISNMSTAEQGSREQSHIFAQQVQSCEDSRGVKGDVFRCNYCLSSRPCDRQCAQSYHSCFVPDGGRGKLVLYVHNLKTDAIVLIFKNPFLPVLSVAHFATAEVPGQGTDTTEIKGTSTGIVWDLRKFPENQQIDGCATYLQHIDHGLGLPPSLLVWIRNEVFVINEEDHRRFTMFDTFNRTLGTEIYYTTNLIQLDLDIKREDYYGLINFTEGTAEAQKEQAQEVVSNLELAAFLSCGLILLLLNWALLILVKGPAVADGEVKKSLWLVWLSCVVAFESVLLGYALIAVDVVKPLPHLFAVVLIVSLECIGLTVYLAVSIILPCVSSLRLRKNNASTPEESHPKDEEHSERESVSGGKQRQTNQSKINQGETRKWVERVCAFAPHIKSLKCGNFCECESQDRGGAAQGV